jgi:PAS domain S-box-containing protein
LRKLSERVATSGFAVALLLLGGVSAISHRTVQQLDENRHAVQDTHEVIESIYRVLNSAANTGKGQRGYILSNGKDAAARQMFWSSVASTDRAIAQLRVLTQDNALQQRQLDGVEPLIASRVARLQQSIALIQQSPLNQSAQTKLSKQSLSLHQKIEAKLQAMIGVEHALLKQRSTSVDLSVQRALWGNGLGNALGFSLLIGIFSLLLNQIRDRHRAEMALQQVNDRLEANVQTRTMELAEANSLLHTELTERQLAEQSLLNREKQLRLITDALPVLISYFDLEQRYCFNNKTYEAWFGASQKDLTGRSLREVVGESAYQAIRPYAETALAGQLVRYESLMPYQAGGDRWVHATYIPDFGDQGEVRGYFALVSDITEVKQHQAAQQQAAEQIRQSEERLHQVLQNMPVMLDAFDQNYNIIEWNHECERVTGYSAAEVVGNPQIMELLYPNVAYRQQMMQAWSDRGDTYRHWEWDITCKDGSSKTISWSNISGQCPIPGWASWGIGMDISQAKRDEVVRKAAEQEIIQLNQSLNRQIKQLETLLEVIPIGIGIAHDPACNHIKVNPAFAKQLGISSSINASLSAPSEEAPKFKLYQNGRELLPEELPMQYATAHGVEVMDMEVEVVHEDGKVVTLLEYAAPLFDEQNQIIGCVGAFFNITERTRLEAERKRAEAALQQLNEALELTVQERTATLNQANEELTRSNQELEQFAYVASHDLQEPLRAVMGYTQLLAKGYSDQLDETGQQYAAYVVEGAARMQQLIQDLLEYSRVGTRDLILTPTHCTAVLERVLECLQPAIAQSSAIITYDPLPIVTADKTQLTQLLQNLIGNAIKFRRELPPRIHISATCNLDEERSHYLFSIRDNGIGIKPRYLERIFEIFKRLHTRREFPGTGIGLAICKKIVDRHKGHIWAESEPGSGTIFYFTIPHPAHGHPNPQLNRDSTD